MIELRRKLDREFLDIAKRSSSCFNASSDYRLDLRTVNPGQYDLVIADNILQFSHSPLTAVASWIYLLKVGGHLVLTVPDWFLYEKETWPSLWNDQHKCSFSIQSIAPHRKHVSLGSMLASIGNIQVRRMQVCDAGYDYTNTSDDQSRNADCSIEVIIRKMPVKAGRKTFLHSGARGDIIYALPTIAALGGGTLYVHRGDGCHFGIKMGDEELSGLRDFLITQPYIDDVLDWKDQKVDVDLVQFRELDPDFILLSTMHLVRFGTNYDLSKPWIDESKIPLRHEADIIIGRSHRYHAPFNWSEISKWLDRTAFVGYESEHKHFVETTGIPVRYVRTDNYMELAGVIKASKLFVGNQSMPYSIAEGMKHPRVLEVCPICANCDPQNENGHTRLSNDLVKRYLFGNDFKEENRKSRLMSDEVPHRRVKQNKADHSCVLCIVFCEKPVENEYSKMFENTGVEVLYYVGERSHLNANKWTELSPKSYLCIINANMNPSRIVIVGMLNSILTSKSGYVGSSTRSDPEIHIGGSCIAITRETYERIGLFTSDKSWEDNILDLYKRAVKFGIQTRSAGLNC